MSDSAPSDPSEIPSESNSQFRTQTQWAEGTEEDFKELKEAREQGTLKKFRAGDNEEPSSEDGSVEDLDGIKEAFLAKQMERMAAGENPGGPGSEEDSDDEEEEPTSDQPGPRLLWLCNREDERLEEVEALLKGDPKALQHRDGDGYSALHRAAYSGHAALARRLLELDSGLLAAETPEGWHPIHSAARWNRAEVVEVLLEAGADPNARTQGGQTPLHLAAFAGQSRETLQLLLLLPRLERSVTNCQGDTPKDIALRNGNCVHLFEMLCDDSVCKDGQQ